VLDEFSAPLSRVMNLKVGDTLMLNATTDTPIELKCAQVLLTRGRAGRVNQSIAVRVEQPLQATAKPAMLRMWGER
jgi:flagellar motor switch protein FliM